MKPITEAVAHLIEWQTTDEKYRRPGRYSYAKVAYCEHGLTLRVQFTRAGRAKIWTDHGFAICNVEDIERKSRELLTIGKAKLIASRAERRESLRDFWTRHTPSNVERLLSEFDAETERLNLFEGAQLA